MQMTTQNIQQPDCQPVQLHRTIQIFLTVPEMSVYTPVNIDRKPYISSRKVPIMQMAQKELWLFPKGDDQRRMKAGSKT